jgi:hypothetical protein
MGSSVKLFCWRYLYSARAQGWNGATCAASAMFLSLPPGRNSTRLPTSTRLRALGLSQ